MARRRSPAFACGSSYESTNTAAFSAARPWPSPWPSLGLPLLARPLCRISHPPLCSRRIISSPPRPPSPLRSLPPPPSPPPPSLRLSARRVASCTWVQHNDRAIVQRPSASRWWPPHPTHRTGISSSARTVPSVASARSPLSKHPERESAFILNATESPLRRSARPSAPLPPATPPGERTLSRRRPRD